VEARPSSTHWDEFRRRLRDRVSPNAWQTWLEPLTPEFSESALTLRAPSRFHLRWVQDRFMPAILESSESVFGEEVGVVL
jgi:chromosomal replication initiation ATPase DnaA